MPLTFAHPAAAVPLVRPLGRWGVFSALVIGSVVPDLFYLLPITQRRASSHTLAGLVWFCLPVGIALYALFHAALKRPLCSLLPASWQRRLESPGTASRARPSAVVVSIVIGALTHLAWDAFTHLDGAGVVAFPVLNQRIASFSGYNLYLHRLLQHVSTLVGVSLLATWIARWAHCPEPQGTGSSPPPMLTPLGRVLVVVALLGGATVIAVLAAARLFPSEMTLGTLQPFVGLVAERGLQSLACGTLLYAAAWHAGRRLTLVRRGR
jgi:uncharacterized protein DUF4184